MIAPEIKVDDRILLRKFRSDDAEEFAAAANDETIAENTLRLPHPYTVEDATGWFESHGDDDPENMVFCIEIDGRPAGAIGLHSIKEDKAEIGYWLGREHWGANVMTSIVRAVAAYGFRELGLARIYGHVFHGNKASARVLEKNGFVKEGLERKAAKKAGGYRDETLYGKINLDLFLSEDKLPIALEVNDSTILRPWSLDDVKQLSEVADHPDLAAHMGQFPHPFTQTHAIEFIEHAMQAYADDMNDNQLWCIQIDGRVAGAMGLEEFFDEHCLIDYWLGMEFQGQGHMSRIIPAVVEHAFRSLGVVRIEARVFTSNPASAKVLERCGFQREGTARMNERLEDGSYADEWVYAIINEER